MTDLIEELRGQAVECRKVAANSSWGLLCEKAADEIDRLEKLVYVPGVWRCAKCDFRLIQSNLNANTGTVTARDTPGDKCPNCHSPLWRVTERQERVEALDMLEKRFAASEQKS